VRPSWGRLALLGAIGGGPTFLGTLVGQSVVNATLSIAFLGLAAGSVLYVVIELLGVARRVAPKELTTWCILLGLGLGLRHRRHRRHPRHRRRVTGATLASRGARLIDPTHGAGKRGFTPIRRAHSHDDQRTPRYSRTAASTPCPGSAPGNAWQHLVDGTCRPARRPHPILPDLRSKPSAQASTPSNRTIADRCLVDRLQRQPLDPTRHNAPLP